MAQTFKKIASQTIAVANTATITFSSIPQIYTDLYLKIVTRGGGGTWFYTRGYMNDLDIFNTVAFDLYGAVSSGSTSPLYSFRDLTTGYYYPGYSTGINVTDGVFAVGEVYIPNYASSSTFKLFRSNLGGVGGFSCFISYCAAAAPTTSNITSLTINNANYTWQVGTTIDLYGILKA